MRYISKRGEKESMKQDKAYIEMQVTDAPLSEQEFEELVKRMRPQLMRMGREFFGSEMEAEEVVQETWLRVWNVRHSATVTEALVMRIARNCCVSMWRGQRAQVELENVSFDEMPLSSTPQEELEEKENSLWLQSRIKNLPPAEREVWALFYDQGLTVEEIAQVRGITIGTVRKTISNVRKQLRTDMRHHFVTLYKMLVVLMVAFIAGIAVAAIYTKKESPEEIYRRMQEAEREPVYRVVEHMPTYPGGFEAMYELFKKEMRHPEGVEIKPGNSRVIIRFIVEKDGRLTHFEVIHSPDEKLSEEALRLMKLMPRWTPAKNKGKVVRCLFTIPVPFGIKDSPQDSPPSGD